MKLKPKTVRNEIEDLTRRSIRIVKDGLDSADEYERRAMALQFLTASGLSVLDAPAEEPTPDEWADEVIDEKEDEKEKEK